MFMSKRTLNLKISENLYDQTDRISKEEHITKTEIVENALRLYVKEMEREKLKQEFKRASLLTRESSLESAKEWEVTLMDGLKDD
jgi:metal-responsive CopG/Arc/MetJ family transcriptional regulator